MPYLYSPYLYSKMLDMVILVINGYKVDNLILWNAKLAELEQLELDSNEFEIYI